MKLRPWSAGVLVALALAGCTAPEEPGVEPEGPVSLAEAWIAAHDDLRNWSSDPRLAFATARETRFDGSFLSEQSGSFYAGLWDEPDGPVDGRAHAWVIGVQDGGDATRRMVVAASHQGIIKQEAEVDGFQWGPAVEPDDLIDSARLWSSVATRPDVQSCLEQPPEYWWGWTLQTGPHGLTWLLASRFINPVGLSFATGWLEFDRQGNVLDPKGFECPGMPAEAALHVFDATGNHDLHFADRLVRDDHPGLIVVVWAHRSNVDYVAGGVLQIVVTSPLGDRKELDLPYGGGSRLDAWREGPIAAGNWTIDVTSALVPTTQVVVGWCATGVWVSDAEKACEWIYSDKNAPPGAPLHRT